MKTKKIFYKVSGRDDENFVFIDKMDDKTYQVRQGTSKPVSYFKWEENSSTMSLEDFLKYNESYRPRVEELIAEFETE